MKQTLLAAVAVVLAIPALAACGNADPAATKSVAIGDSSPSDLNPFGEVENIDLNCGEYFAQGTSPDYSAGSAGFETIDQAMEYAHRTVQTPTVPEGGRTELRAVTDDHNAQLAVLDRDGKTIAVVIVEPSDKDTWLVANVERCTDQKIPANAFDGQGDRG